MPKAHPKRTFPSQGFKKTPAYSKATKRLGQRLRKLRERNGWTLEQAEEHLSFDWKHLGKLETGKLNVTIVTLLRLADGYGVELDVRFRRPGRSRRR